MSAHLRMNVTHSNSPDSCNVERAVLEFGQNEDIIRLIITQADCNPSVELLLRSMEVAHHRGNQNVFTLLCDLLRSAYPSRIKPTLNTAIQKKWRKEWLALLLPDYPKDKLSSLMETAIAYNHLDAFHSILELGVDINGHDYPEKMPPLCAAVHAGVHAMVKELIALGADVNVSWISNEGHEQTPLLIAFERCSKKTVLFLLDHNASPFIKDGEHETSALHLACGRHEFGDAARYIIAHKLVDVNMALADGYTPFCFAAQTGSAAMMRLLLEAGSDPNVKVAGGLTPLHIAARNGHVKAVKLLLSLIRGILQPFTRILGSYIHTIRAQRWRAHRSQHVHRYCR